MDMQWTKISQLQLAFENQLEALKEEDKTFQSDLGVAAMDSVRFLWNSVWGQFESLITAGDAAMLGQSEDSPSPEKIGYLKHNSWSEALNLPGIPKKFAGDLYRLGYDHGLAARTSTE